MRQKIITLSVIVFLSSMLILSVLMISAPGERLRAKTILSASSSPPSYDTLKASDTEGLRNIHGVKIVSPMRGQKLPVDKNLTVIGTSIANSTSNCLVSIALNGIMPYQRAKAIGPNGTNDYSLWGFVITPNYAPIKAGDNQLKAKFSCVDDPTLLSYYTTNITGIMPQDIATPVSMNNNSSSKLQQRQFLEPSKVETQANQNPSRLKARQRTSNELGPILPISTTTIACNTYRCICYRFSKCAINTMIDCQRCSVRYL